MATQTFEFNAPTGSGTFTAKFFAVGSDTVVATASATEATNRKGRYTGTLTDFPPGTYNMIAFLGSVGGYANEVYVFTASTATFIPESEKPQPSIDPNGYAYANLVRIGAAPVAVDTGTAGTVSFVSGSYVATSGETVNANVVQVGGENIHDDGDGRMEVISSSSGAGSSAVTVSVASGASAITGALVTVLSGSTVVAYGTTGSGGTVVFNLDSGTYTARVRSNPSYQTPDDQAFTVSGDMSIDFGLTAQSIDPPSTPGLCTVRFIVLDAGSPVQGVRVTAELASENAMVNTALMSRALHAATTDADGIADLVMVQYASFTRGGAYLIKATDSTGRKFHDRKVTVPSSTTAYAEDLPDA